MAKRAQPQSPPLGQAAAVFNRGRITTYVAVGLAAALVFMLVSKLVRATLGLDMVPSAAIGFGASLLPAYLGHRRLTFRSTGSPAAELPRFLATSLLCFGLTLGCTHLFASSLGLPDLAALALTSVFVPVLNFLLLAGFVFVRRPGAATRR